MAATREIRNLVDIFADQKEHTFYQSKHADGVQLYRLSSVKLAASWYARYDHIAICKAVLAMGQYGNPLHQIFRKRLFPTRFSIKQIKSLVGRIASANQQSEIKTLISLDKMNELIENFAGNWDDLAKYIHSNRAALIQAGDLHVDEATFFQHETRAILQWMVLQFVGEDQLFVDLLMQARENGNTPLHDAFSHFDLVELAFYLKPLLERIQTLGQQDQLRILSCRDKTNRTPLHLLATHAPGYLQELAQHLNPDVLQSLLEVVEREPKSPFQLNLISSRVHVGFLQTYLNAASDATADRLKEMLAHYIFVAIKRIQHPIVEDELVALLTTVFAHTPPRMTDCVALHDRDLLAKPALFLQALSVLSPVNVMIVLSSIQGDRNLFNRVLTLFNANEFARVLAILTPGCTHYLFFMLLHRKILSVNTDQAISDMLLSSMQPYTCLNPLFGLMDFLFQRFETEGKTARYQKYINDFTACLHAIETGQALPFLNPNDELMQSQAWFAKVKAKSDYGVLRGELEKIVSYTQEALDFFFKIYLPVAGFIDKHLLYNYNFPSKKPAVRSEIVMSMLLEELGNKRESAMTTSIATASSAPPSYDEALRQTSHLQSFRTQTVASFAPSSPVATSYTHPHQIMIQETWLLEIAVADQTGQPYTVLGLFVQPNTFPYYFIPLNSHFAQSLLQGLCPSYAATLPQPVELKDTVVSARMQDDVLAGFDLLVPTKDALQQVVDHIPINTNLGQCMYGLFTRRFVQHVSSTSVTLESEGNKPSSSIS